AFGGSAEGVDDVDIAVTVVIADECDPRAVRAEPGERLEPRRAGERTGDPPCLRPDPEIVGVAEDDGVVGDVRELEHPGVRAVGLLLPVLPGLVAVGWTALALLLGQRCAGAEESGERDAGNGGRENAPGTASGRGMGSL